MAIQIITPVDTGFPMNPSTVETEVETEGQFAWISLLCCSYGTYHTGSDVDWETDIDM